MATVHRIIGTRCVLEILAALRGEVIRVVFQASPASEKLVRRLSTLHQMMHRMGQNFRDSGHLVSLGPSPPPSSPAYGLRSPVPRQPCNLIGSSDRTSDSRLLSEPYYRRLASIHQQFYAITQSVHRDR